MVTFYNKNQMDGLLSGKDLASHSHPQIGQDAETAIHYTAAALVGFAEGDVTGELGPSGWEFQVDALRGQILADELIIGPDSKLSSLFGGFININTSASQALMVDRLAIMKTEQDGSVSQIGYIGMDKIQASYIECGDAVLTAHNFSTVLPLSNRLGNNGQGRALLSQSGTLLINANGDFAGGVSVPMDLFAAEFNVVSSRELKEDVCEFGGAIDILRRTRLATFRYKGEPEGSPTRAGIIADESPVEITSLGKRAMDLTNMAGVVLAAVRELVARQHLISELGGAPCP